MKCFWGVCLVLSVVFLSLAWAKDTHETGQAKVRDVPATVSSEVPQTKEAKKTQVKDGSQKPQKTAKGWGKAPAETHDWNADKKKKLEQVPPRGKEIPKVSGEKDTAGTEENPKEDSK